MFGYWDKFSVQLSRKIWCSVIEVLLYRFRNSPKLNEINWKIAKAAIGTFYLGTRVSWNWPRSSAWGWSIVIVKFRVKYLIYILARCHHFASNVTSLIQKVCKKTISLTVRNSLIFFYTPFHFSQMYLRSNVFTFESCLCSFK